jgi:tetratricopeptide (TPR) repeat protein
VLPIKYKNIFSNQVIILAIILIACFFSYLQITNFEFLLWDDNAQITENVYVKNLYFHSIKHNITRENYTFLPLTIYSVVYKIWGDNPAPFHWISIILHLLNVLLVFKLSKQFSKSIFSISLITLLFALHPMRVESVAWISELKDLLFTFFSLIAFLFYFNYLKSNFKFYFFILAAIMVLLASFSKIQGLLVPVSFFLFDIYYKRKVSVELFLEKLYLVLFIFFIFNLKIIILLTILLIVYYVFIGKIFKFNKIIKTGFVGFISVFGIGFLIYYFIAHTPDLWSKINESKNIFSFFERFLLAGFALWFYIKSFFLPVSLNAVHPYPLRLPNGAFPSEYYFTLVVLLVVFCFSLFLIIKRSKFSDLFFFGWFFFLVNISIVLHFISIEGRLVVADRYTYLAYFGLFISLASVGEKYLFKKEKLITLLFGCLAIILCALSLLTYNRCKVWKNTKTLFTDVVQKDPLVPFAYSGLASFYMLNQLTDSAIICFNKAISIDSLDPSSYFNRAFAFRDKRNDESALKDFTSFLRLTKSGKSKALGYMHIGEIYRNSGKDSLTIYYFDLAIKNDSTLAIAYNSRGIYFLNKKLMDKARADFNQAVKLNVYFPEALNNLGSVFLMEGKLIEAQNYFNRAILVDPEYILAYDNRGYLKYLNGDAADAIKDFNKAIKLGPKYNQVYINRGRANASLRNYKGAIADFSYVLQKEPKNMNALTNRAYAYFYDNEIPNSEKDFLLVTEMYPLNAGGWQNLAWFHMLRKDYKLAVTEYEKSIDLDSSLIISYINLGWIYMEQKDFKMAEKYFTQAQSINPNNPEPLFMLGELYRKKENSETACVYYKRASDLGNAQAKNALNLYCKSKN